MSPLKTPAELPKVLADNLQSIDQRLFLRLAEMSDSEQDDYEKLRIRQLATLVSSSLETIIEQADKQMSEDAEVVQGLLRKMALDNGEFELPVPPPQLAALREAKRGRSCSNRCCLKLPADRQGTRGFRHSTMSRRRDLAPLLLLPPSAVPQFLFIGRSAQPPD